MRPRQDSDEMTTKYRAVAPMETAPGPQLDCQYPYEGEGVAVVEAPQEVKVPPVELVGAGTVLKVADDEPATERKS
jgi:hypothetical protein